LEKENKLLQIQLESQEQYSRRNCLLLYGIPVAKLGENKDEIVKEFMNTNLGIKLNDVDI